MTTPQTTVEARVDNHHKSHDETTSNHDPRIPLTFRARIIIWNGITQIGEKEHSDRFLNIGEAWRAAAAMREHELHARKLPIT